jgi:hypothetical protein
VDVLTWIVGRTPNAAQKANRRPDLRRLAQYVGAIVCALLHRHTTGNNLNTIVGVPDEVRDLENLFEFVVIFNSLDVHEIDHEYSQGLCRLLIVSSSNELQSMHSSARSSACLTYPKSKNTEMIWRISSGVSG